MKLRKRMDRRFLAVLFPALLLHGGIAGAQESAPDEEDPDAAALRQTAETYVKAFNERDAAAIAALYTEAGEIVNQEEGTLIQGREAIEARYASLFEEGGEDLPTVALEVDSVRLVTPQIAIEDGTLHFTLSTGEVSSSGYSAVLAKQEDGSWLTASVRDRADEKALPAERILAFDWIIGDWQIQANGSNTYVAFDWSEDGPFIDGKALTEESGMESTSSTYRIGWDGARESYVSWGFDALGGYTLSEWTETDEGDWLLRSVGVTAEGERNHCTQTISLEPNGQYFTWTTSNQTIGGEIQSERSVMVVKRPPEPGLSDAEPESDANSE